MLDRHDLTDAEWARLEPLLPDTTPQRGGRWADHRTVLNAVFWRTRCGVPWRDVPASFGSWKTIYNRHRRWSADGTWERVLEELRRDADSAEGPDWTVAVDMRWCAPISTPPAPGTDRRLMSTRRSWCRSSWTQGARSNDKKRATRPAREAIGRSRGGLTSKIVLAADRKARPISQVTVAGHRHDSLAFPAVMDRINVKRCGPGRPRTRPARVLGDKAFSSRAIRSHLRRRQITATIPEPADQIRNRLKRGSHGGRPPAFDPEVHKQRNCVERAINKLKGHRAVATRFDSATTSSAARSTSPRSASGSATPSHDPRDRL